MKILRCVYVIFSVSLFAGPVWASMEDDPVVFKVDVEELEYRSVSGDDELSWDVQAWVGKDRDKLWLKSEGDKSEKSTDEFEIQLLYNRSVAPFWDMQLGWRHDWQPTKPRDWLAVGVAGQAPGFIDTEVTLFIGDSGRSALRIKAGYELLFTQKLSLRSSLELNGYGEDDVENGVGSGLATLDLGARLHYALGRQFLPYIGVNWQRLSGSTADLARSEGESDSDLQALVGISFWF